MTAVRIIGAGLAGSEAAWQCSRRGIAVELCEMRPVRTTPWGGRIERVDGGQSRDISIIQAYAEPGTRTGDHAHAGDEHHVVLSGRWRMEQNGHEVEAGPGDYVVWDAELPHDVELLGDEPGSLLIVSVHPTAWDPAALPEADPPAG